MRPVLRVPALTDACLSSTISEEQPSSPMDCSPPEMVFPFDGEGTVKTPVPFEMSAAAAIPVMNQLEAQLAPTSEAELMLARHVELAAGGAHRVDCEQLVQVLQRLGYSAKLHESSGPLYNFKRGVRHQFVSVCLPDTSCTGLATYIVEPNFRDCFCVAHPTPRYAALLDGTPAAVVATKANLHRAVTTLSREMARSFSDQGEDLPPWRTAQALLSKWQLGGTAGTGGAGCSAWAAGGGQHGPAGELFGKQHYGAYGAA